MCWVCFSQCRDSSTDYDQRMDFMYKQMIVGAVFNMHVVILLGQLVYVVVLTLNVTVIH